MINQEGEAKSKFPFRVVKFLYKLTKKLNDPEMFLSGWDCETGLVFWLMLGTVPIRGVQREPILLKFILFSSGKNVIFVNVSQVESPVITVNFFSFPKGLSHLVAASFTEDQFGVVQTTLPAILNTLLTLQEVKTINCSLPLNKFIRGEGVLLILYFDTSDQL